MNCICPGYVSTPLAAGKPVSVAGEEVARHSVQRLRESTADQQPLRRAGEPWDIAQAALFLTGDDSEWITGHALVVDGGLRAGRPWRTQASWVREPRPIRIYRPAGR